jgi:hypothetical protein
MENSQTLPQTQKLTIADKELKITDTSFVLYLEIKSNTFTLNPENNVPVLAMIQMPGRSPNPNSSITGPINQTLIKRVQNLSKKYGITNILSLVNQYEMRSRGVDIKQY